MQGASPVAGRKQIKCDHDCSISKQRDLPPWNKCHLSMSVGNVSCWDNSVWEFCVTLANVECNMQRPSWLGSGYKLTMCLCRFGVSAWSLANSVTSAWGLPVYTWEWFWLRCGDISNAAIHHMMYRRPPGPHVSPHFVYINALPFSLSNEKIL